MQVKTDITVANDAATKKKYVKPEIEVIPIDNQPKLLSASAVPSRFDAGFGDDEEGTW